MNKNATDLFPMRVNPFNFKKDDVVKKVITDKIQTPYVGLVTAIIPSTNKVEVQWPHGMGIEDPWNLIKVNPIINPPVVNEDKAYKTYQNQLSHDYFEKIQPNRVLKDYLLDKVTPILMHASDLYNEGKSKGNAYKVLKANYDNERIIKESLERIYPEVNISFNNKYGWEVALEGDGDFYKVSSKDLKTGDEDTYIFDNVIEASQKLKECKNIIDTFEKYYDPGKVVGRVSKKIKQSKE